MSGDYLIDTCIWVDVERGTLAPADVAAVTGEAAVYLSPVTIAELKYGAEISPPRIKPQRLAALARLMTKPLLRIDATTGETFGGLCAQLRLGKRAHAHRVQDLWLAAQAVQHGLRFLTHNAKDFQDIPGLDLRVWHAGRGPVFRA